MASILFKWLLLACCSTGLSSNATHPIYVSVTEIEYNAREKSLELSCKIFTDDFEKTLRQGYSGKVDLLGATDKAAMNKLVSDYVKKHLIISVSGKPLNLDFIGYEQQEEGIVSFFQSAVPPGLKKLDITNNILYEYKSEQFSIIHCIVNGNRKSVKLVNPETKTYFEF
ncbi:MAG: hypothetical protein IPI66_08985 [Chitinophagaceae bacterium]|nr:hypothetical protein [Chitinophagaceae bacterium]